MGYGNYSLDAHKAITAARAGKSQQQVFVGQACHPSLDPKGVRFRQSCDSAAHPASVGIVFALDVSGSMEAIPQALATATMPTFMANVLPVLPDAQVCFMAFGNVHTDRSPLQVGQFESDAANIDRWLKQLHIEGGGGGFGESYDLPMYFAARHTALDCWDKRKHKGYFFMTGDEVPFINLDAAKVLALVGDLLEANILIHEVAAELLERYHVFFLVPDRARDRAHQVGDTWRQLLGPRVIVLDGPEDTAIVASALIGITEGAYADEDAVVAGLSSRGLGDEQVTRVARIVRGYLTAFGAGPLPAVQPLSVRKTNPPVSG